VRVPGWLLFVLAAALSASTIWREIGPHDEGLMLQAAHRIASGELPYRDFWWNYGPGQPYVLAGLEQLFDRSLVPWRVLRVLLDATVALLAYRLAVREVAISLAHDLRDGKERAAVEPAPPPETAKPAAGGPSEGAVGPGGSAGEGATRESRSPGEGTTREMASPPAVAPRETGSPAGRATRKMGSVPGGATSEMPPLPAGGRREPAAATSRWLKVGLPLLAWLAVAGAMAFPTGPGPNPAALALGLGAILVAPRRPGSAGFLAGLAALFRPEIGAAAALGAALVAARATRATEGTSAVRRGVNVAVAAVVVAVLGWLPFALAAPDELLDQTVGFLGIQGQQRLPFPLDPGDAGADPNKLLERYLPLLLVVGLAVWLVRRSALALAPLAAAGLLYLLGRTDEFHLVPLAAVLPVMLVAAAARERLLPLRGAAVVVVALIAIHGVERKAGQLVHAPALAEVPGPAGDGVSADAREVRDLRRVLRAVRGKTIFVAPPRFSQVTVGNPLLYVLAGRENPTRYDVMQPGVVTTAKTQREMVRDLRRRRPDVLVRWLDPRTAPEDNESGRARGEQILDRYLSRAYGRPQRFGVFAVSERR